MELNLNKLIDLSNQKLLSSLRHANQVLGVNYPLPEIRYDLKGKAAGMAYLQLWKIRINAAMLLDNSVAFIDEVIPHELAHLIVYRYFTLGKRSQECKPHGIEWQYVMSEIFKLKPKRTHQFKTPKRVVKRFSYMCPCREHFLTGIKHNRIESGERYYNCTQCKGRVVFTGNVVMHER